MIMLDTDVMIDILRKYKPSLDWLSINQNENIALSGFVLMELIQGCKHKPEQIIIEKSLKEVTILWPSHETCQNAYSVYSKYHLSHNIGILDALIGQTAVDLKLPIYTFNEKHYNIIPGIIIKAPYKKITE
jgi:predicted nucleic acid-binding protein